MKQPSKPRPDFPLTPCGNGQWRKIVAGRPYYFGSWRDDPLGHDALKDWVARKDSILAGLDHLSRSATNAAGLTVRDVVQRYLKVRGEHVKQNTLQPDTYRDYIFELNRFDAWIGSAVANSLKPEHFSKYKTELEKRKLGPHAMKRAIACVKACFNRAMSEEWISHVNYGHGFCGPDTNPEAVAMHHLRAGTDAHTERILTRREVRKLLRAVQDRPDWKALVLLMLNTAMNPAEIARLKWSEIKFASRRLDRRRWKTGIRQEAFLWKRTIAALNALPRVSDYVFTDAGKLLVDSKAVMVGETVTRVSRRNKITEPFIEIAVAAGVEDCTPYTIRRTARTLAANCDDDNASRRMMGQQLTGRDQTYIRSNFPLKRLKRISLTVYRRLFPQKPPGSGLRVAA